MSAPDIPPEESIISAGYDLMKSTSSWKLGKTYHNVITCYRPKQLGDSAPWHCRISEHTTDEATFDQFWDKLGRNKATNEQQFIPVIKKAMKVKALSENAEIWTLYYTFTPPVSPRVFTVLQVTHLNDSSSRRTGLIVSIPVDISDVDELAKLEEKGVRGRYVSVELFTQLENGNTEWRMATSSTPGGSIPAIIAESTMPSTIAQDVPHFFKWFRNLPK
ncbi:hypothetical protein AMATHDRAFT_141975 [Amanita thiersii Skay4041]|uniref:DUF3074 domain-containing protein n=1 Tax=Amanita thiersii Skay4041 TaxID=703135 RepID=A0A2A9NVD3_9AGAR|nr:hypothetical protein AMATHDRAFT_141975 [Amanita thiersii Skay4041]